MKKRIVKITAFLLILVLLAGTGYRLVADEPSPFQSFQEALYLIRNFHVDKQDLHVLLQGAIEGMVNKLDEHSSYLTEDEYKEMQQDLEGHFGGIGIVITIRDDQLTIVNPIEGTPGEKVGLKTGDKIMKIDGQPTKDMNQDKAVKLMRGKPGTPVVLTIKREEEKENLEFKIIRSDIEVPYVKSKMITDQIGYVIISQFVENSGIKVEKALEKLQAQGAKGIILELRNNPGGLLNEAVNVASNFIPEGKIVSIRQRNGKEQVHYVNKSIKTVDLPLVVLVNGWSASSSEIVSGAIRDYNRGKLIGTKTYGKGTVQNIIPLSDGSALRLTTARYYLPGDESIDQKGIKPDIEVKYDPDYKGKNDNQLDAAIDFLQSVFIADDTLKNAS